jgi:hypothetical protein
MIASRDLKSVTEAAAHAERGHGHHDLHRAKGTAGGMKRQGFSEGLSEAVTVGTGPWKVKPGEKAFKVPNSGGQRLQ